MSELSSTGDANDIPGANTIYKIKWSSHHDADEVVAQPKTDNLQKIPLLDWNPENAREYSTKSLVLGRFIITLIVVLWLLETFLVVSNVWWMTTVKQFDQTETFIGSSPGIVISVSQFIMLPVLIVTTIFGSLSACSYLRAAVQFSIGLVFLVTTIIMFAAQSAVSLTGILAWKVNNLPRISFICAAAIGIPLFIALLTISVARLYSLKNDVTRLKDQSVVDAKNIEL
jgi:hypothetical protein